MLSESQIKTGYPFLDIHTEKGSINRLLAAAVINKRFCELLLRDPEKAILAGYGGETFSISHPIQDVICSIKAKTLTDFTQQLLANLPERYKL